MVYIRTYAKDTATIEEACFKFRTKVFRFDVFQVSAIYLLTVWQLDITLTVERTIPVT